MSLVNKIKSLAATVLVCGAVLNPVNALAGEPAEAKAEAIEAKEEGK